MVAEIVCGVVAGLVALALLFRPVFGDLTGFWECFRFWLTPDVFSLFRGEWEEDWWSEMKLGFWLAGGVVAGVVAFIGAMKWFGGG